MVTQQIQTPFTDVDRAMATRERMALLGGLSDAQARGLFSRLLCSNYRVGEIIYRQNEISSSIFVILSGAVRMIFDVDHHPLLKADLRLGDCFGETSVIGIQGHSASAVAAVDTELLVLEKPLLMQLYSEDKELFSQIILNIAREVCRRLHETDRILMEHLSRQSRDMVQLPLPGMLDGGDVLPNSSLN